MKQYQYFRLTLCIYLLLLSFKISASDSESIASNMEECKNYSKSFEESWPLLQSAVDKIINRIEGVNNSTFTNQELMSIYTTVYELCTNRQGHGNAKLLYVQHKKVFEDYINSKVVPSLRGKKDENLLRELLRRWSNHKFMTSWLSRFFHYIDRYDIPRLGLPSLEETSFLAFNDLVYDEMNKQVVDAILSMVDQERAGEKIDRKLVIDTLAIYSEIGKITRKNDAKHYAESMIKDKAPFYLDGASNWIACSSSQDNTEKEPLSLSKKINLISSEGDILEVDYEVALMSRTIEDVIKTNGFVDSIPVSTVSSKILAKAIDYCKKHKEAELQIYSDIDLNEWDAEFLEVDQQTLFELVLCANYLNIKSLLDVTSGKIGDMMKGKTPQEIRKIFNIKDDFTPKEEFISVDNQ